METRNRLKALFEREPGPLQGSSLATSHSERLRASFKIEQPSIEKFEHYTATHTYADVLCEFSASALPPFEYLLSIIPVICPRLYSIASSPLYRENKLDLLIVLNEWTDPNQKPRSGLTTRFLFGADAGDKVAIQVRTGILQPPRDTATPLVMFGLGTGVAPFRGFLQHRQRLLEEGKELGPATLYVGYRHEQLDYYLKESFAEWTKLGVLTAVHPAFSHDDREKRGGKLYFISDLIGERPKTVVEALRLVQKDDEAKDDHTKVHVYYCGPALGIPETIQKSMEDAVKDEKGGGMKEEDAVALMDRMVRLEDRFHADCC